MVPSRKFLLNPRKVRLEASTVCQLRCPACPTATGETGRSLGSGFLRFPDFKKFIDQNPRISTVELSNWGEVLLNRDLLRIVEYAHKKRVALYALNGTNLNRLDEDVAEALVRHRFRGLTCSIDGASQETYSMYRVRGDFQRVIQNIKTINRFKALHRSPFPMLHWQFVAFGHNEHEIDAARSMARDLGMSFTVKLSWEDLYTEAFSPVMNEDRIREASGLDVATRSEYREKHQMECYQAGICAHLWVDPQINFDGRVLGCTVNYWGDFGNAFQEGLATILNNERMNRAREMLLGRAKPSDDIPCTSCTFYRRMKTTNRWLTETELRAAPEKRRWQIGLENVLCGRSWTWRGYRAASRAWQILREEHPPGGGLLRLVRRVVKETPRVFGSRRPRPWRGGVHPLWEPMHERWGEGWEATHLALGRSGGIPSFGCHISQLAPGIFPHPPHRHAEEEILLVLSGKVEVILPDVSSGAETFKRPLGPGEFAYYPSYFGHTVKAVSRDPARYLMLKWRGRHGGKGETLGHGVYEPLAALGDTGHGGGGLRTLKILEGPTEWLGRLQCHSSFLPVGSAYPPHVDPYDVAIVLLRGEVETLGRRVEAGSLVLCPSGQPHGMRNAGEVPAEYIVFELQGRPSSLEKALDPGRWLQKIRSLR